LHLGFAIASGLARDRAEPSALTLAAPSSGVAARVRADGSADF